MAWLIDYLYRLHKKWRRIWRTSDNIGNSTPQRIAIGGIVSNIARHVRASTRNHRKLPPSPPLNLLFIQDINYFEYGYGPYGGRITCLVNSKSYYSLSNSDITGVWPSCSLTPLPNLVCYRQRLSLGCIPVEVVVHRDAELIFAYPPYF